MRALRGAAPRVVIHTDGLSDGDGGGRQPVNSGALSAAWQLAAMQDRNPQTRRLRTRELLFASMEAAMAKAMDELQAAEGEGVICVTGSFRAVASAMRSTTFQAYF